MKDYIPESKNDKKSSKSCRDSGKNTEKANIFVNCGCSQNGAAQEKRCKNLVTKFEYDERTVNPSIEISTISANPTLALEVNFSRLNPGDRVWLSGVLNLFNNNNTVERVSIRITRTSPSTGTPQQIYINTLSIDIRGRDSEVLEPFSHVDVITTQLFDVRYRVLLVASAPNMFLQGTNTLTANRYSK